EASRASMRPASTREAEHRPRQGRPAGLNSRATGVHGRRVAVSQPETRAGQPAFMETARKLSILADAAKYDASCASSGAGRRDSTRSGGIGSTEGMGICHSYTPDGRCVSLLKILLTNFCVYDCAYCVNRVSSNVERARFRVDEVVKLTLDFYRRNYIEGLFLS